MPIPREDGALSTEDWQVLRIDDVARLARRSRRWVEGLMERGELQSFHHGRGRACTMRMWREYLQSKIDPEQGSA